MSCEALRMFERYTGRARRVVELAEAEAKGLGHNYLGCEHLLLGVLREPDIAGLALKAVGVSLDLARTELKRIVGSRPDAREPRSLPVTPRARRVLEDAQTQATMAGAQAVGTAHVLLALLVEREGVHGAIFTKLRVDRQSVVNELLRLERDPKYGAAAGRAMMERSVIQANTWLAVRRHAERVATAIAGANSAEHARERVEALLGVESWVAEFVIREPLIHVAPERAAEMRERRECLLDRLESIYGPDAAAPFRG